ncbi:MAG: DUF4174 domain-containing protein [Pseudomonadota bacterium]
MLTPSRSLASTVLLTSLWSNAFWPIHSHADPSEAAITTMNDFAWERRPLLIFAPSPDTPLVRDQRAALAAEKGGLLERDMLVIEIIGQQVTLDGQVVDPQANPSMSATSLRQRYLVAADRSTVLLVGKDTGVKLQQSEAFSTETLFTTIDAMPMRRREMRE